MSGLDDSKVEALAQTVGALVKSILGKEADFVLMPSIDNGNNTEMAIISSMKKEQTTLMISMAASKSIDSMKEGACDCPRCSPKKFEGNVVDISDSNNIH